MQGLDRDTSSNSISAAGAFDTMLHTHRLHGRTDQATPIPNSSTLVEKFPNFFSHAPGFRGIFDRNAGWVDAARALEVVGRLCQASGVRFVVGPKGTVKSLVRNQSGYGSNEVTGVLMEDGSVFNADKIVMCVGAYTESLIDMEGQVTAVSSIPNTNDQSQRTFGLSIITHQSCFPSKLYSQQVAYSTSHITLTPSELKRYQNMPVMS
jgi:sarcosine oxidase/L-pipecolate oxidase